MTSTFEGALTAVNPIGLDRAGAPEGLCCGGAHIPKSRIF